MPRELPTSDHCFQIGVLSCVLWWLIAPLSLSCHRAASNRYTKRIFLLLVVLSATELPWATQLASKKRYTGKFTFSLHMLSTIFFFATLCTFCFAINDVLRSGEFGFLYIGTIKRKRIRMAMLGVNIITLIVILGAIIALYDSDDLDTFLSKPLYKAFILFSTLETMALGLFIVAFVGGLRSKISVDKVAIRHSSSMSKHHQKMVAVANKLSLMLFVFMTCFSLSLIRVVWWLLPSNNRYAVDVLAPNSLKDIDFWWWLIFALLPTVVPSFVFIFTMGWPSKYFFHTHIPDKKIASGQTLASSGRDSSSSRPRQGSESADDYESQGRPSLTMQYMKGRSKDFSVESDDAEHVSALFSDLSRYSLNEDLIPHHEDSSADDTNDQSVQSNSYKPPDIEA